MRHRSRRRRPTLLAVLVVCVLVESAISGASSLIDTSTSSRSKHSAGTKPSELAIESDDDEFKVESEMAVGSSSRQ